jgi:hypothetical protein
MILDSSFLATDSLWNGIIGVFILRFGQVQDQETRQPEPLWKPQTPKITFVLPKEGMTLGNPNRHFPNQMPFLQRRNDHV